MKKLWLLLAVVMFLFSIVGCKDDDPVDDPDNPPVIDPTEDEGLTLSFETYGGVKIDPIKGLKEGEEVKLPTPVRNGYTFDYWYTTPELSFGTDVRKTVTVNEDMTLYAGWFALDYNIEFISNCSVKVKTLNALTDEPITLPVIERSGYNFLGWYDGDEKVTVAEGKNYDLVAKWVIKSYEITFDSNGSDKIGKNKVTCTLL